MQIDDKNSIFWLHIKKSAGISTRKMLSPLYKEVDRIKKPGCFIQSEKVYWNDILNNYRTPLGEYQFKRMLFAKKFLFSDLEYKQTFKFAFSRNPEDRCLSQFFYLWYKGDKAKNIEQSFDKFLVAIEKSRMSNSNRRPLGLHFQTHTAKMSDDITDENGTVLLDSVFRLEQLSDATNFVMRHFDNSNSPSPDIVHVNKSKSETFVPSKSQKKKISELFAEDYDIYERCNTQVSD